MSSLNLAKITIAGHLVRDPELKMTPAQVPCTTFSVAVNRKSDNGSETVSDFYTVIAWRGTAETICRYFRKGSAIYVEGKLRLRSYTDKNGNPRKIPEVIASDISFVDSKNTAPTDVAEETPAQNTAVPAEAVELISGTDDDLPF